VRPTDESIARGINKVAHNVAETAKNVGKGRKRSEPVQRADNAPLVKPRSVDPHRDSNPHQNDAIRERKALQRKLERSDRACEGLQQGYDYMKDMHKMIGQNLKQKEDEILKNRETIRIMDLDAARREKDLQNFKAKSADTVKGIEESTRLGL
jgi:hypothetical protein